MAAIPQTETHLRYSILKYIAAAAETCTDEDQRESLQVASQCLAEGFGLDVDDEEQQRTYAVPLPLPQLFQVGLVAVAQNQRKASTDSAQAPAPPAASTEAPAATTGAALMEHPKYKQFIETLTNKGFFKGLEEGSPEFAARMQKAHDTFEAKYGKVATAEAPAAAPAVAPAAAPAPAPAAEKPPRPEPSAEEKQAAEACKAKGNEFLKKKQYDEAIAAYSEALDLCPENPIYLSNRAAAHTHLGQHDEAVKDCEQAIESDAGYVKAYSRLGFANYQLGSYQASVDAYEKGLVLDPGNSTMRQGLENAQHKQGQLATQGAAPDLSQMMSDPSVQNMMGSLGNNPDLTRMMQDPAMMNMAQQMMSDPAAMQNMMGMMSGMMGGGGNGPDPSQLAGLMNNPMMAQMAQNLAQNNPDMVENMQRQFESGGSQ